jgi:Phosphatidylinositol 3- and 4-kinase
MPNYTRQNWDSQSYSGINFFYSARLVAFEFPYIGSQRSFTGFQVASSFTLKELLKLEYSDFWKLFIFDVITGNGDRNLKNFFLKKNGNTFDYIPIDHGLSLLVPLISCQENDYFHFVCGYNGIAVTGVSNYSKFKKANLGTLIAIASANPIYRRYYEEIKKSDLYFKILHFVQTVENLLSRTYLDELIHRIPEKLFMREPNTYRSYLLETLLTRIGLLQSSINAIAALA